LGVGNNVEKLASKWRISLSLRNRIPKLLNESIRIIDSNIRTLR